VNPLAIPGVDTVLEQPVVRALLGSVPREVVVQCIRETLEEVRAARRSDPPGEDVTTSETAAAVAEAVARRLEANARPSLRRVVNATGVVIHTNLGRSPLSEATREAISEVSRGYCNLEVDVASGERTKRELHVAGLLARLSGAETATVVNNNAAAVVLTLTALASGQRVLCSRGELVEIGGSFRLPEIIACSGATMVEVGTTNHTRLSDYERALTDDVAAILKTHRSNFRIVGFTSEVEVRELADLARRARVLLIFDAGSGMLLPSENAVFASEPVIRQAIADGADIVTFSTDKLLGGPQGGAIVGRRSLVERINRHPLKRAVRVGKLTLAGLEATLRAHMQQPPATVTMEIINRPVEDLEAEARRLAEAIEGAAPGWRCAVEPEESSIGGGSMPGETIPTWVVWLEAPGLEADALGRAFRENEPPIFGRYRRGRFGLDVRTLLPGDGDDIVGCVGRLAEQHG